jgi:hypothetical protein
LENAVEILKSGELLSRNDAAGKIGRDIAGMGVIDASVRAHKYARLYFRPRTPTQYHVEGIRRPNECQFGRQAPVLIMLVFDARGVLSHPGVKFSDQNMQTGAIEQESEEFFSSIPFDKVYHDSAHDDPSITKHRCAEVLAPSPLKIGGLLQWIYCRSEAEKETLLAAIPPASWHKRVVVSDDLRVFHKRHAFAESVSLSNDGLILKMHPRFDGGEIDVRVRVRRVGDDKVVIRFDGPLTGRPPGAERWRIPGELEEGFYDAEVSLEGELAYRSVVYLGETPF